MSVGEGWLIQDLPEEPPRPRRRIGGHWGLLILVGVLLLVTVAAGVRPRAVGGTGSARTDLALPTPGECLRWDVDVTDPPEVVIARPTLPLPAASGSISRTPCSTPHQGQVALAWRVIAIEDEQAQRTCNAAADIMRESFPERSPSGWTAIHGDRRASMVRTGDGPLDYVACVLIEVPYGLPPALFTLSDRMSPGESADPHWCLTDRQQAIGCQQAHTSERVGIADEPRGVPSCTGFAHTVVGVPGDAATFAGTGLTVRSGMLPGAFGPTWFCDVVAPPGRRLTSSVVGLGNRPLPVG